MSVSFATFTPSVKALVTVLGFAVLPLRSQWVVVIILSSLTSPTWPVSFYCLAHCLSTSVVMGVFACNGILSSISFEATSRPYGYVLLLCYFSLCELFMFGVASGFLVRRNKLTNSWRFP